MHKISTFVGTAILGLILAAPAGAVDDRAAERLMRTNDCAKCHTLAREKEGPPYKKVAEKYKGKADAEKLLLTHLQSEPVVKVDGKDEKHKKIQADNEADIKNLVQWILTR
jgi:cytochrome c